MVGSPFALLSSPNRLSEYVGCRSMLAVLSVTVFVDREIDFQRGQQTCKVVRESDALDAMATLGASEQ